MPIQKTQARLWQEKKEEQDDYDDKMISNIELKSTNFDDENFSPVFTRTTQEYFLEPSDKFRQDTSKVFKPFQSHSFEQLVDKYILIKPNHTYYRNITVDKFLGGFGLGYLLLRELPLRNFYARCFVMYVFAAKLLDNLRSPVPFSGHGDLVGAVDRWNLWDVKCYDNVYKAENFTEIPTAMNKIRESRVWNGKQPAHIQRSDVWWVPAYFASPFKDRRQAYWDGTMNMPIMRLADPKHKDSYMMVYY